MNKAGSILGIYVDKQRKKYQSHKFHCKSSLEIKHIPINAQPSVDIKIDNELDKN